MSAEQCQTLLEPPLRSSGQINCAALVPHIAVNWPCPRQRVLLYAINPSIAMNALMEKHTPHHHHSPCSHATWQFCARALDHRKRRCANEQLVQPLSRAFCSSASERIGETPSLQELGTPQSILKILGSPPLGNVPEMPAMACASAILASCSGVLFNRLVAALGTHLFTLPSIFRGEPQQQADYSTATVAMLRREEQEER